MLMWDLEKVLEGSNKMMIDPHTNLDTNLGKCLGYRLVCWGMMYNSGESEEAVSVEKALVINE